MAGTLIRLQELGYEVHYMTIANGALGGNELDYETLAATRMQEAKDACAVIGAVYHPPIAGDMEVFYNFETLAPMVDIMREVDPEILITHGTFDYMEDHVNAGRIAVSAAFARGMGNFRNVKNPPVMGDVAVYHSLPMSLKNPFNKMIEPDFFVDVTSTIATKRAMLSCHRTQKEWLDASQKLNAYLEDMEARAATMGALCGCKYAEAFVRHNPLGFCPEDFDPLQAIAIPAKH